MKAETVHAVGNYDRVLFAVITAVDPVAGKVSIAFLDQFGLRDGVPIPVIAMSNNAWIRFIPQVNDVVQIGLRGDDSAAIIGWHPWAYKARTGTFDSNGINAAGGTGPEMMQTLKPGEIDMRAIGGGYLRFNNVGDVLLMGISGRLQIWGIESLIELAQNALKLTDGLSWLRFGIPFRFYPKISERELPASGAGQPANSVPAIRERDTRIIGADGNLLVHEGLGTVMDEGGTFEVSGATGGGSFAGKSFPDSGKAATGFLPSGVSADNIKARLAGALSGLMDPMRNQANIVTSAVVLAIQSVVNGLGGSDGLSNFTSLLRGILAGSDGTSPVNGLGNQGKELRKRLHVFNGGKQVFAMDVDENGGTVITSSDVDGVHINAPSGGVQLFAKRGLNLVAKGIALLAETITEEADDELRHVAGTTARRVAGTSVKDNAPTITRTAEQSIQDKSGGSYSVQATSVTINSDGSVSITASGTVTITGAAVLLNP